MGSLKEAGAPSYYLLYIAFSLKMIKTGRVKSFFLIIDEEKSIRHNLYAYSFPLYKIHDEIRR